MQSHRWKKNAIHEEMPRLRPDTSTAHHRTCQTTRAAETRTHTTLCSLLQCTVICHLVQALRA